MLLSSLQGAAITSIRIETTLHEFSSLAGVRVLRRAQDHRVTDSVFDVKQIALRMEGKGPARLLLLAARRIRRRGG